MYDMHIYILSVRKHDEKERESESAANGGMNTKTRYDKGRKKHKCGQKK
jgi:hypothetical protein